jgi:hypothetical protein
MKRIFLSPLVIFSIATFGQNTQLKTPSMAFEKYGYIDGIRLDSITSEYAEVNTQSNFILFDYGQEWVSRNNYRVTDAKGYFMRFSHNTIGTLLNFMNYNGWQFVNSVEPQDAFEHLIFRRKK